MTHPEAEEPSTLLKELRQLREEVQWLRQERDDLEIALITATEHGDMIEEQLETANQQLKGEIRERKLAESRLQALMDHLKQQKDDLEVLVDTVTQHSDRMDHQWLELYTTVERLSLVDGLTQIANRRAFDDSLEREWKRGLRSGAPLGLIMGDVDFFKLFNDRYGHPAGDECLVRVARALAESLHRPEDLAARYGGEEFVMLLPQTGIEGVVKVADAFRRRVLALSIPHERSHHGVVTVSLGVASLIPQPSLAPEELLAEADQHLYAAKREGRNTVRCPGPFPASAS